MNKFKKAIYMALTLTTLTTALIATQISSSAITFKEGDLVTTLPSGEKFYYTESNVKWDKLIKSSESTSSTSSSTTGQVQTIETVKSFTSTELSIHKEKQKIEIVMQIPTVVICANQYARGTDIRIIKINNNLTRISWKKQIIKEANIIRIVGEVEEVDVNNPNYEFDIEFDYTGDYVYHHKGKPDTRIHVTNQVIKKFAKFINFQSITKIDTVNVSNISDVILNTKCSYENSKYKEFTITKKMADKMLSKSNLKVEVVKSNNQEIDNKCFKYEIVTVGEQCKIRFWADTVTTTKLTQSKLIVTYTNSFNMETKQEIHFNVKVLDLVNDVN